ncbi:MAG: amidase [Rhodospirillales bacterium]|nr:amidase [Rhodospirillales bacterium]MDE2574887.1 amidase [Rhodospirillales bacterium]
MVDLARLSATDAARRMAGGTLRREALLEACLERIVAEEGAVRAFASFDPALPRAAAPRQGPLHGLPIGVKDVIDTADMPSEYGSPIWRGHRPHADAACVAWARAAGAVVLGKTVTTEFATRHPGPTANPRNLGHTPGGSSSGSAAGVAAGFFPLAFATQTAGSIIRPAAFCGVVGYKPSFGTLPRLGMKIMSESLDTIGVIAREVADCALFVGALSGRDLGDPDRRPGRAPRIGLCRSPSWEQAGEETRALWERVATALGRAGAALHPRELPAAYEALATAHPVVMNAESAASMGWELATAPERLTDGLRERLGWGLAQGPAALDAARATFAACQDRFAGVLEGLDILVTPAAPGEAPAGLGWTGDPAFNYIWTALGVPCVTVPAGSGPGGLPLGIQIVGGRGQDRAALAWAQWVAAALA